MNVQIGDVWEFWDKSTRIVSAMLNGEIGYTYYHIGKCGLRIGILDTFENWKLIERNGHKRPGANESCCLRDCLLFEIGTKEEWKILHSKSNIYNCITLDSEGKLPKPIQVKKYTWGEACTYAEQNRGVVMGRNSVCSDVIFRFSINDEGIMNFPSGDSFRVDYNDIKGTWIEVTE